MTAPANPLLAIARTSAFRLASLYVAASVLAAALVAGLVVWRASTLLAAEALASARAEASALAHLGRAAGLAELARAVASRGQADGGGLYLLVDAGGAKLAGNLNRLPPELRDVTEGAAFRYAHAGVSEDARVAVGILSAELPAGALLVVGRDLEPQRRFIDGARWGLVGGLGLLALLGLGGGLALAGRLRRRVEAVTAASEAIMTGDLAGRLPVGTAGDEIDALSHRVNTMLARIEQLLASLKEVSDNIAHDLKTPVNRLRNRAEAALRDGRGGEAWREGLERTIEDADAIIKTFNALLLISRLEAGALAESLDRFDLGALVRDVAELYEPAAEEAGLAFAADAAMAVPVEANRQLVGQAVANLLDNAIKYSLPSSAARPTVAVSVACEEAMAVLTVADQGPGIAAADRARALERFVRLDKSRTRPGTGLGLSLVAAVARMHGGTLTLEDNGPGLKAVLRLPRIGTGGAASNAAIN